MIIADIVRFLEAVAAPSLQESYDNATLLTGHPAWHCNGIICCLDVTEAVIEEAVAKKCNLVVAHHPVIFGGLKKLTGSNYVERTIIKAIKNDVAIYAIHTNLDNVITGVNGRIAAMLQLQNTTVLAPKKNTLLQLTTFVPDSYAAVVRNALFDAGAGHVGNYSNCSFNLNGTGTFEGGDNTTPFVGEKGQVHEESEVRIEVLLQQYKSGKVLEALKNSHPYEEVAYYLYPIENEDTNTGAGLVGYLAEPVEETIFLQNLKAVFGVSCIKHTAFTGKKLQKIALCGGAGSFLTKKAIAVKADAYITSDIKYNEFFDADGQLLLADIGHFESEQFTIDYLKDILEEKFTTFAILKTGVHTNPVKYFTA